MSVDVQSIAKRLAEPFPSADIEWRVGATNDRDNPTKGIALAYITNRAVQQRLDDVMGIDNWRNEYLRWGANSTLCGLSLRINGEWVTKWDGADDSEMEAVKGGLSDSMKRSAYQWGIGRYLYNLDNVWVPVEKRGRTAVMKETPRLPDWALPESERKSKSQPTPPTKPATTTDLVDQAKKVFGADKVADKVEDKPKGDHPNKTKVTEALCKSIYIAGGKIGLDHQDVHNRASMEFDMPINSLYDLGKERDVYMKLLTLFNEEATAKGGN